MRKRLFNIFLAKIRQNVEAILKSYGQCIYGDVQYITDLTFRWPCILINSYNKTNYTNYFLKFVFGIKLYMLRTVPLFIIRSFSLYTLVPFWSCSQAVRRPVWRIPQLCVQWKTPDNGLRDCPKHVEFYSKNKFGKLVHLRNSGRWDVGIWTGLGWLRIETGGGRLWVR